MEGIPEDMWSPYKHLYRVIEKSLKDPTGSGLMELDLCLKKYKQIFSVLLRNPPKNEHSRKQLKNGITEGISIPGHNCPMLLSKDLVDECIIISDMFDLDEYLSIELLCTAQRQMPQHPGLTRGLVAILLYYDGRKAIACSLRDLFQATSGISWITDVPKDITHLISSFTQNLVEEYDILSRIIDILDVLDIKAEIILLTENRAFGSKKHKYQVLELYKEIRLALAMAFFNWSAQRGLTKNTIARLIQYFASIKNEPGSMDDAAITMLMAYLYAIDTSSILRQDDISAASIQTLPVLSETGFTQKIYEVLTAEKDWGDNARLHNFLKFSFGLTLASLRQVPQNLQSAVSKVIDRDEQLVDNCLSHKVFDYIYYFILEKDVLFNLEFFYRRMHLIFTDFIVCMNSKITELRGRADETARTVMCFAKEGLEPPANLDHNFEMLMLCIGKFYKDNRAGLSLCVDYWGSLDYGSSNSTVTSRSVSLFKFIRLAGELLPPSLFVSYLKMIAGLSSCEQSARNTFNLLKQASGLSGSATLSWEHFFGSLTRYYTNLRQEHFPGSDTIYKSRLLNQSINPQEIDGLCAVLGVVQAVATYDEIARVAICEHPNWAPIHILLGLLTCSIPLSLKAQIARTLATLAKTRESAIELWNNLETSQIISTTSTKNSYYVCNLEMEIEQNECRAETFPLTQSVLDMLYALVNTVIPRNLGTSQRQTGCDTYLRFVINGIFLKFYNRNYKDPAEKWVVAEKCLKFLNYLVKVYEISPEDFVENFDQNAPPGFYIMLQLHTKSDLLRQILLILDETVNKLDDYSDFAGKEKLEECALHSLNIIGSALSKQNQFFDAHSVANSCILLSGINKLLMDVNPRTRRPDYILVTTKFLTYNSWLPRHALAAVNILGLATHWANVNALLIDVFTQSYQTQVEIRHGFVECLECEILVSNKNESDELEGFPDTEVELQIKEAIINLMHNCLTQPAPNLTHFLLGFEVMKESNLGQMQRLTTMDSSSNCTKSLVCLLDNHLDTIKMAMTYDLESENIAEKAYSLLYSLCSNQKTSDTILRYLRSCSDFLSRHLAALPFPNFNRSHVLTQMSYLLKCVAVELKQIAHISQISRFQYLCELLMGFSGRPVRDGVSVELSNYFGGPTGAGMHFSNKAAEGKSHMLLCYLIDLLEFEIKTQAAPNWCFFESSMLEKILKDCETELESGRKLINIKKLHDILNDELCTVQSSIVSAQRQVILQEIDSILSYALQINDKKSKRFASVKFLDAWGQVTEMLFTAAPELALPIVTKQELILEILQKVLGKVVAVKPIYEMGFLLSGTVLLLLVNLKYCNILKPLPDISRYNEDSGMNSLNLDGVDLSSSVAAAKSHALSLKFILRNILEWIIVSEVSSQKLRINLYAALLNCMCIIRGTNQHQLDEKNDELSVTTRLDKYKDNVLDSNQIRMSFEVFRPFGEKLLDIVCHDCTVGHDICKMSALSCIETLLDVDPSMDLINYISHRGYLSHIIESLSKSDDALCRVLKSAPENMRALYVYESKMALMIRISNSNLGAELLLRDKILDVLSSMQVFDMHPDVQASNILRKSQTDDFIPSVHSRYRQILFPALYFCDNIISTLGTENFSAISQVLHFLLSHSDTIETILRCGTPFMELGLLQELSEVTGIIARTINQELLRPFQHDVNKEVTVDLFRIRQHMLSSFSRFIINETTFKEMYKMENVLYEPNESNKGLHKKYFLEIASNLALYCRNAISNHSADHKTTGILFSPNLSDTIQQRPEQRNVYPKITQSLGDVLNQLKGSVEYHNNQKLLVDNLMRQRTLLPNLAIDAKSQATHAELSARLKEIQNELLHCSFVTEQCLYLLWSHLDFYMRGAYFNNRGLLLSDSSAYNDSMNFSRNDFNESVEDMGILRKHLISIFNETFSKNLLQTLESSPPTGNSFALVLLRRIKSLIQFSSKN